MKVGASKSQKLVEIDLQSKNVKSFISATKLQIMMSIIDH